LLSLAPFLMLTGLNRLFSGRGLTLVLRVRERIRSLLRGRCGNGAGDLFFYQVPKSGRLDGRERRTG
jgi:hypothetical protein